MLKILAWSWFALIALAAFARVAHVVWTDAPISRDETTQLCIIIMMLVSLVALVVVCLPAG